MGFPRVVVRSWYSSIQNVTKFPIDSISMLPQFYVRERFLFLKPNDMHRSIAICQNSSFATVWSNQVINPFQPTHVDIKPTTTSIDSWHRIYPIENEVQHARVDPFHEIQIAQYIFMGVLLPDSTSNFAFCPPKSIEISIIHSSFVSFVNAIAWFTSLSYLFSTTTIQNVYVILLKSMKNCGCVA